MPLQSSGPISISEIKTELGSSSNSLRNLSSLAGFSTPDSMSEFYGFAASTNSHYLSFDRGDALKKSSFVPPINLSSTQDMSISMWVKQGATQANVQNQILFDMSANNSTTTDRFFLQYDRNGNRFVLRMRTNSQNFTINYEIENNNSSMGLGTNTSTYWSNTNRGATNSDGWSLLTVTYDASQSTPANAFKFYWNNNLVTTGSGAAAGSRTSRGVKYITLGNNNHNPTTTAGGYHGLMDEVKIYTSVLTSAQVNTIWNAGVIENAENTHDTLLFTEFTFDTDTSDSTGFYPIVDNNTATRTAH